MRTRGIVFPAIRRAEWETIELPDPGELAPTQVLLRARCTLISAGTEIAIYSGQHIGYTIPGATYPRLPFRPGYSFAGTVEAVGSAVTDFRPGDRVCSGSRHAAFAVVDTARSALIRIPDEVGFEAAALSRLATISLHGVRLARLSLGERVAVFGQGVIGQFARQLCELDGAALTIAIDQIDSRLEVARRLGATHTLNPQRDDVPARVRELTGGSGVEVAIEATGNPAVIPTALAVTATLGRVVLLGSPRGRVEIDPYTDVHRKGLALIGAHASLAPQRPNAWNPWTAEANNILVLELMRQGRMRTEGLVSHRIPADEAPNIFEALTVRPQDFLGVIIEW
jgi:2-desacetyl-2-hydroxyethyl bacteriochlorophyllide A dehydrogenase